jgi:hypothetical protein
VAERVEGGVTTRELGHQLLQSDELIFYFNDAQYNLPVVDRNPVSNPNAVEKTFLVDGNDVLIAHDPGVLGQSDNRVVL